MARLGYFRGRRAFLLDGEIFEMASQGNWHVVTIGMVTVALTAVFPMTSHWIRIQAPIDLPDGSSDQEPDLALVSGTPTSYVAASHPSTALLVVEVADTSLKVDRRKANAYASANVQEYWIVDIVGQQLEVHRRPIPDPREPFGHRYDQFEVVRPGGTVPPLAAAGASIPVADLLPKQPVPSLDA